MSFPTPPGVLRAVNEWANRLRLADNSGRTRRRGSVLIIVIALLVLMAVIGTAYVSTARVDRGAAAMGSFNTQIDLLVQAVEGMSQTAIWQDVTKNFWTASDTPTNFTSATQQTFLSTRTPVLVNGNPGWLYISAAPINNAVFESPYNKNGSAAAPAVLQYGQDRQNMVPTSVAVTDPTTGVTVNYPALLDPNYPTTPFLAASAAGDGIADSALFRLPCGEINGVTYYAAVRIIDNNSAVNASTAWTNNNSLSWSNDIYGDFFPTNINLQGLMAADGPTGLANLNYARYGNQNPAWGQTQQPVDDGGNPRADFTFISPYDAMWMQLGRRLGNPGYLTTTAKYQALPMTECGTLAYHFCLPNPQSSPSIVEQAFPKSLRPAGMQSGPYAANQTLAWFAQNFNYSGETSTNLMPRRALATARNGISTFTTNKFTAQGTYASASSYKFGDMVQLPNSPFNYVCIQPVPANSPADGPSLSNDNSYWAVEPWTDHITKTPVNTATFNQLWLAYWNVMTDSAGNAPDNAQTTLFRSPIRNPSETVNPPNGATVAGSITPSGGDDTANIQAVINSSSPGATINFAPGDYNVSQMLTFLSDRTYIGAGGSLPPALTPIEVLKLRAAMAAANTMTLRAGGNDVVSHQVFLGPPAATAGATSGATKLHWTGGGNNFLMTTPGGNDGNITVMGIEFDKAAISINGDASNVNFIGLSVDLQGSNQTNDPWDHGIFVSSSMSNSSIIACSVNGAGDEAMEIHSPKNGSQITDNIVTNCWNGIHVNDYQAGSGTIVARNDVSGIQRNAIECQGDPNGLVVRDNYVHGWVAQGPNGSAHMGYSIATGGQGPGTNGTNITITNNVCIGDGSDQFMNPPNPPIYFTAIEIMGKPVMVSNNYASNMGCAQLVDPGPTSWSTVGNTWCLPGAANGQTTGMPVYTGPGPAVNTGNQTYSTPNAVPPPHLAMNQPAPGTTSPTAPVDPNATYSVMVYGTARNPYMTRVYADNDSSNPNGGYIAVELYNPYNQPITMTNWQLATLSRASGVVVGVPITPLTSTQSWSSAAGTAPTIAAHGWLTLVSSATPPPQYAGEGPSGVLEATPPPAGSEPTSQVIVISDLNSAFNNELVLLRPRRADGQLTVSTDPNNSFNEKTNVQDLVPVDSYDFTGLVNPSDLAAGGSNPAREWYYARPNDPAQGFAWHFVYPGAYNITNNTLTGPASPRLSATTSNPPGSMTNGLTPFGTINSVPTPGLTDTPIQLDNDQAPGPNPAGASNNFYPFGAFARNGDLLHSPFIGAYRIQVTQSGELVELNPVTIDSTFAKIAPPQTDGVTPGENIGRFTPVFPPPGSNSVANDYSLNTNNQTPYHFSTQLFDYLTVNSPVNWTPNALSATWANPPAANPPGNNPAMVTYVPSSANLPNVDPAPANPYITPVSTVPYPGQTPQAVTTAKAPALNPTSPVDDTVPLEGLININTAPWPVLATLPMVDDSVANANLAKAIVYFRDVDDGTGGLNGNPPGLHPHGPFKTLWELNEVAVNYPSLNGGTPAPPAGDPTWGSIANQPISFVKMLGPYNTNNYQTDKTLGSNEAGDLSPQGASNNVYNDFESQNLALTRISNLITTRSDMYTVYVIVQGWRNVGTSAPSLIVQRRAAFLADRTPETTSTSNMMTITNIPNN